MAVHCAYHEWEGGGEVRDWVSAELGEALARAALAPPPSWRTEERRGAVVGIMGEIGPTFRCEGRGDGGGCELVEVLGEEGALVQGGELVRNRREEEEENEEDRDSSGRGLGGGDALLKEGVLDEEGLGRLERMAFLRGVPGKFLNEVSHTVSP